MLLGNVGKLPGGFVLMPDATIDNGRLEVVVAGWRGAAGFSQVATQVINPKLVPKVGPKLSTMERYLTTGIRVTTAKARRSSSTGTPTSGDAPDRDRRSRRAAAASPGNAGLPADQRVGPEVFDYLGGA